MDNQAPENRICHICNKPVRISKDSFAYSIKEGYSHFDCMFPNHTWENREDIRKAFETYCKNHRLSKGQVLLPEGQLDDISDKAPAEEKRIFNYPK